MQTARSYAPTRAKEDDPAAHSRRTPVADRILARVLCDAHGCWIWTGALRADSGYGVVGLVIDGRHTTRSVHRVAHEEFIGPIPAGMHVDHKCGNRACVNPDHLEAVTQAENNARMWKANRMTHCKRGHEFTPANTMPCRGGARNCRTCRNANARANRAALRAAG